MVLFFRTLAKQLQVMQYDTLHLFQIDKWCCGSLRVGGETRLNTISLLIFPNRGCIASVIDLFFLLQ